MTLEGGGGNDTLIGGSGNDALIGGSGNDTYDFSTNWLGSDTVTEQSGDGSGTDTLSFASVINALTLTLGDTTVTEGTRAAIYGGNIEKIEGGTHSGDLIIGANAGQTWTISGSNDAGTVGALGFTSFENHRGGTGNDTFVLKNGLGVSGSIDGREGNDTLTYSYSNAVAVVLGVSDANGFSSTSTPNIAGGFAGINTLNAGTGAADSLEGRNLNSTWTLGSSATYGDGAATLGFSAFERVVGAGSADTFNIQGNFTATLQGGAGDDTFDFKTNAVTLTGKIEGQAGPNTLKFSGFTAQVSLTLSASGSDGFDGTGTGTTQGFNQIRAIVGGTASNDVLAGRGVTSTWTLGSSRSYDDGAGFGTLGISAIETLQGGSAADTFNIGSGIAGSLNLKGGSGADVFKFADGATLPGNIDGEGGSTDIDTLDYSLFTTGVVVNIQTAAVGIEKVVGGSGNDNLIGSSGNETLVGGAGNDTLEGGDGSDVLQGGAGNDSYVFDDVAAAGSETDVVQEVVGEGKDTLDFSRLASDNPVTVNLGKTAGLATDGSTKRTVNGSAKNVIETVFGGAGADHITGRKKGDAVDKGADKLEGRDGNDTIFGLNGNDTIDGGAGDDSILGGTSDDHLSGGAGNDLLDGDQHNDVLVGGTGNDNLIGDAGNDDLNGEAGDDVLVGGKGIDRLRGDIGADNLTGNQHADEFDCGTDSDSDTVNDFTPTKGDTKNANCG